MVDLQMADDETNTSPLELLKTNPPPDPLPDGWIMHRSKSQSGYVYYYNQFSGESRWELPFVDAGNLEGLKETIASLTKGVDSDNANKKQSKGGGPDSSKRPRSEGENDKVQKKARSSAPEQVRVLHILKKHKGSRRPASWRNPKITITEEEARAELEELIAILDEVKGDPKELRATFEELAKTESDCSSAKRGGDLGFFGRKKMQPPFENASFALEVGELSGIVVTSSGFHVILRLG